MYKFIKERDPKKNGDRANIIFEITNNGLELETILAEFKAFLLACGFNIPGEIVVEHDEDIDTLNV